MKFACLIMMTLAVIVTSSCSTGNIIARDYDRYLKNNERSGLFQKVNLAVEYEIDNSTVKHNYSYSPGTVGYDSAWVIEFGKILQHTINSQDVQEAFLKLTTGNKEKSKNSILRFKMIGYEFRDHRAFVSLNVSLMSCENLVFDNTYNAKGRGQGGKIFLAGTFGIKNAVQQSTKSALDKIFHNLISDINTKLADVKSGQIGNNNCPFELPKLSETTAAAGIQVAAWSTQFQHLSNVQGRYSPDSRRSWRG